MLLNDVESQVGNCFGGPPETVLVLGQFDSTADRADEVSIVKCPCSALNGVVFPALGTPANSNTMGLRALPNRSAAASARI